MHVMLMSVSVNYLQAVNTYHSLQVAYLVFRLVQKLVLIAFLLQQEKRFPEGL